MFWKNVNKNISIHTRLAIFYSLSVFILLTAIALILYWSTINILHKTDFQFLADEVESIQYLLRSKSYDRTILNYEVVEAPRSTDRSIYRYYIRVFDQQNKLLAETPGINNILPAANTLTQKANVPSKKRYWWYKKNNTNYLFIQSTIELGENLGTGIIQIALDTTYQHNIVDDRKEILFILLIGFIGAVVFGMLIAKRGVRSLTTLTETAENITINSLHQRIDPSYWPNELVRLANAMNRMLDRVEASYIQLKRFAADLAHELRTPINNLTGEVETLLTRPRTPAEYQLALESNLEELQKISRLIENILFLAKTENPQYNLEKIVLHASEEINFILEYYQAMAEEKNISLTCTGDATFKANRIMFQRVINNLIANAISYTQEPGQVTVTIKNRKDNLIEITIQDNGVGIASEHLPHLFERFFRVDASRSSHITGIGLGLPITKSIIDLHHGHIHVISQPGEGTTVSLLFPK